MTYQYKMTGLASLAALAVGATVAFAPMKTEAATLGYTEGTRNTVVGTTKITAPDTSSNPNAAFDLLKGGSTAVGSALAAGDRIEIFGRIVSSIDNFFFIDAASKFNVSFIFGGYDFFTSETDTSTAPVSGLTGEPAGGGTTGKDVAFRLLDKNDSNNEIGSKTFTSETTSGNGLIFTGGPGQYVLQIDGRSDDTVALYDVAVTGVSAVPLPAAGWLMLAGFGGLAALRRRKQAA